MPGTHALAPPSSPSSSASSSSSSSSSAQGAFVAGARRFRIAFRNSSDMAVALDESGRVVLHVADTADGSSLMIALGERMRMSDQRGAPARVDAVFGHPPNTSEHWPARQKSD